MVFVSVQDRVDLPARRAQIFFSSAKRDQENVYFFGDKVSERLPEPEMRSEGL